MILEDDVIGIGFWEGVNDYFAKITDTPSKRYFNSPYIGEAITNTVEVIALINGFLMVIPRELME